MRVVADRSACIGSGQCVLAAPAVFDQDDEDGLVRVLDPAPPSPQSLRLTVQGCPARALSLVDEAA